MSGKKRGEGIRKTDRWIRKGTSLTWKVRKNRNANIKGEIIRERGR